MQAKLTGIILMFFAASFNANAGGGGGAMSSIVFDPTNHVQTTISAARAVRAEVDRATQIYNQIQQYREQLLQNQITNPTVLASLLTQNAQDMNSMQSYVGGLGQLLNATSQQQTMAQNRIIDIRNSGLNFSDYAQREQERIAAGDQLRAQRMQQERAIMDSVANDTKFVQDMQSKIPTSVGLHDSARDMNTMLNKLVAQNSTIIQMQTTGSAITDKEKKDEDDRNAELQEAIKFQNDKDKGDVRNIINQMGTQPTAPSRKNHADAPLTEAQRRALGY